MSTLTLPPPASLPRPMPREHRPTGYSPEDLLIMPDGERFELVDGQLKEKSMSGLSSWVGGEVLGRIRNSTTDQNLGWVFGAHGTFQCFPDAPNKVRIPDVSFVSRAKLPGGPTDGHIRVPPDLAVEVASANDVFQDVDEKVEEYLAAGVKSVWLINPHARVVTVIRANGTTLRLRDNDELTEPEILPGFACRVRDVLPPLPEPAAPPTETSPVAAN